MVMKFDPYHDLIINRGNRILIASVAVSITKCRMSNVIIIININIIVIIIIILVIIINHLQNKK